MRNHKHKRREAQPADHAATSTATQERRGVSPAWRRSEAGTLFRVVGVDQHAVRQGRDGRYRWEVRYGVDRSAPHRVETSLASWGTEAEAVADLLATLAERDWRGVA